MDFHCPIHFSPPKATTMTLQCLPAGISTFSSCLIFVIVTSCVPTARPPWALFSYEQTYYVRVTQNEPRQNNLMLLRRDMLRCARQPTIIRPLAAGDAKWGSCRAWSEDWQEKTIKIGCRRAAILKDDWNRRMKSIAMIRESLFISTLLSLLVL